MCYLYIFTFKHSFSIDLQKQTLKNTEVKVLAQVTGENGGKVQEKGSEPKVFNLCEEH